ncbi:Gem (Nuclear organelle) associated protein 6 [Clonorchis sinensis]|uniref:Gem (Nuclear organelle) associated protein 6 n=2 Tax=Clonorchis sinensis TaxID=79923 RepID=A0A8T1M4E4_CLOSI|nr:Gem (Nuclear organelle) associated protein 6 [Clonorchis sinensis]GAA51010.1 gem associated protein 6 [Clonorchis sinensis]
MHHSPTFTTLLYKRVKFYCQYDRCFEGYVYAVDPESGNYVIYENSGKGENLPTVICAWAIKFTEVIEDELPDKFRRFFDGLHNIETGNDVEDRSNPLPFSESLEERKKYLIDLFQANFIELKPEMNDVFSVNGVVFIHPPYTIETCSSTNVVALDRVKKLLRSIDPS